MATLKRNQMKYFSEDNMRKIISLTISLANKVDATAEKCINPFTPNTAYTKGSFVTYNNYIYEAKYACNDPDFVEAHWVKLSDEINEIDLDTVKSYLGLTQQQLDTLASIISTEIRLDKCFSSSDTYMRIQDAIKEAKQYCITELAKKSTGSFKKANDVSEVTDGNYLYLILNPSTSKYDIYALVDSNVELLTSVDVSLDNYFTKQEITDSYYDKATCDGKFATITTVDAHINDTVAHMTQDEKDKLVTTDNIATTISGTPSDEKVASEKAVSDVVSDTVPFKFGIDDKGNYGYYKAGADTVTPFRVEPTQFATGVIANLGSESITIDISKRYLVSASLKYTEPNDTLRLNNFYVSDGIVQELIPSSISYGECTLSGNTLTINNTNTTTAVSLYLCYSILEF